MYSKERGYSRPMGHALGGRGPAYRQPQRQRMQVPPNYSGNAIVDGEERPLGQTEEDAVDLSYGGEAVGEGPVPTFGHLPRVSELGAPARAKEEGWEPSNDEPAPPPEKVEIAEPPREPARPVAPLFDASRFPFGHGIGFEELLLLGLILFFLHESSDCADRGDLDETVILLGLLLLLG